MNEPMNVRRTGLVGGLIALLVIAISLSFPAFASAAKGGKGGGNKGMQHHNKGMQHHQHQNHQMHKNHGMQKHTASKFKGRLYKGKNHHHWRSHRHNRDYGCETYDDPNTGEEYYWCPPDDCYYPVSYCPYGTYTFTK